MLRRRQEQLKQELIDQAVARVRQSLDPDRAGTAATALAAIFRFVAPRDVLRFSEVQLRAAALSLWGFARHRTPGTPLVRAYNPTVEDHGWHWPHTILEVVNDDMPFLVDSVTAAINRLGLTVHLVVHPILSVARTADHLACGLVRADAAPIASGGDHSTPAAPDLGGAVPPPRSTVHRESLMHIQISHLAEAEARAALEAEVLRVLGDVARAVGDWQAMRARIGDAVAELRALEAPGDPEATAQACRFLEWLQADNFTLLGYREYRSDEDDPTTRLYAVEGSGLGLLHDPGFRVFEGLRTEHADNPQIQAFLRRPDVMVVTKANRVSTVHRSVLLDVIAIKRFDATGGLTGERLFLGLFTSTAYARSASDVPFIQDKVARVLTESGLPPGSHAAKKLVHVLNTFPRDELFQVSVEELLEISTGIVNLQDRQSTAVFLRIDPFERYVTALVYVPRDRYETMLRRRMQMILEQELKATGSQFYVNLDDGVLARVHFVVDTVPGQLGEIDQDLIEARIVEAARSWHDVLLSSLIAQVGEVRARTLIARYGDAFPAGYREQVDADTAIHDLLQLQALERGEALALNLYRPAEAGPDEVRFKLYLPDRAVVLADVLPTLENMGLRVLAEVPYEITTLDDGGSVAPLSRRWFIHDFTARVAPGVAERLGSIKGQFHDAFRAVWHGAIENDAFNALVLAAGLDWREVVILRGYGRYLRQARTPFSQTTLARALTHHPAIARDLVQLFHWRFDPARQSDADKAGERVQALTASVQERLQTVTDINDDLIVRRFLNLIEATLRTNYYQTGADHMPKTWLSFKLDGAAVADLPEPRMWREIFVYAPNVEAIHLRGGAVARGGLRWSDRREDFRTEVLGLVKAQRVKNAVIVPVGSKGGFYPKHASRDPAQRHGEGVTAYRTFLQGMLDITDNLRDGQVVPPPAVVRHDGDDPYLVVAADKGTATFSDIANGVARDYGFWLDDAFASGGSAGYDHKKMGITARGAWESVRHHFRRLGHDTQRQPFSVIGIGDMSGDVFGNGMLLSPCIRLLAAFNHLHIFVDPDPRDLEAALAERQRLFDLPRSTWEDYRGELLSPGARIYRRSDKRLRLTPEIQRLTGLTAAEVSPSQLMRALLVTPVDLLWFGGIGTYVKATHESQESVGDKANDALRVNGAELRAKVVAEGANLGMTQAGRIEFAQRGGHLNTDFIDNSAGVDTSDHEVNIKILLRAAIDAGALAPQDREPLLAAMTQEVGQLVLEDNYRQNAVLSQEQTEADRRLSDHDRLIRQLEASGRLSRAVEGLPDEEEIAARGRLQRGLTRPELAVLLSYAKIDAFEALLASDLPDDPDAEGELYRYFPTALRERFADQIRGHQLKREIIATVMSNSLVNRMGITFVRHATDALGVDVGTLARAFLIARDAFDLEALWAEIDGLDLSVPYPAQRAMTGKVLELADQVIGWLVTQQPRPLDVGRAVALFRPGVEALMTGLETMLSDGARARREAQSQALRAAGVPADLATQYALLPLMSAACDITCIAERTQANVEATARVWFAAGDRFSLQWLRDQASALVTDDLWERQAIDAILDELFYKQGRITEEAMAHAGGAAHGYAALEAWAAARPEALDRVRAMLTDLRQAGEVDLARLAVANRRLGDLVK